MRGRSAVGSPPLTTHVSRQDQRECTAEPFAHRKLEVLACRLFAQGGFPARRISPDEGRARCFVTLARRFHVLILAGRWRSRTISEAPPSRSSMRSSICKRETAK